MDAQASLVRLAFDGARLVIDRSRRLAGRGVYVHAKTSCVITAGRGGLARSLRREVAAEDVKRIAAEMSPSDDNSDDTNARKSDRLPEKVAGLAAVKTVEKPLIKAKGDRSEDARL